MPQPARFSHDPNSPLTPLPRGYDDVEWAAVYQTDDEAEMTDAFDVGAFLRDLRQSEEDAANAEHYRDEPPFYPEPEECRFCRNCEEPIDDSGRCPECAHRAAMED